MEPTDRYPELEARFYDAVYRDLRTGTDSAYYLRKMREADGPVLEVGVGTGRLLREALRQGVDAHGIDVSTAMLDRLRAALPAEQHYRVTRQDLRQLDLDRRFALVVAPFRVFSHLVTVEDQLAALERVAAHLEPGGQLIFDVFVPDPASLARGMDDEPDFDGEHTPGQRLRRFTSMRADIVAQLSHVTMRYVWEEQEQEHTASWSFPMRFYFRYELEHLVHRSPLELVTIHGDFNEGPLGPRSRDFVVVCRRGE